MKGYDAHITRVATGETRVEHFDQEWDETADYMWEEGNYSCDCNRAIFFHTDDEPEAERECGDGDYVVRIVLPDGSVPYADEPA